MEENRKKNLAIASLILSIVGIFTYGIFMGGLAVVFGAISLERGMGKVGMIIGIIDIALVLIIFG